jgi:hypothetical protein
MFYFCLFLQYKDAKNIRHERAEEKRTLEQFKADFLHQMEAKGIKKQYRSDLEKFVIE